MDINNGLPIHADATVDDPARESSSRATSTSISRRARRAPRSWLGLDAAGRATPPGPVQLDRVLAALTSDARGEPPDAAAGARRALNAPPTPARGRHAGSDRPRPDRRAGAEPSLKYSADAFRGLGDRQPGAARHPAARPLPAWSRAMSRCSEGSRRAAAARELRHTFNATMATLASRQQELSQTIALLPPLLRATQTADARSNASFAPTQQFAAGAPAGRQAARPDDQRGAAVDRPGDRAGLTERARRAAEGPDARGPEHVEHARARPRRC